MRWKDKKDARLLERFTAALLKYSAGTLDFAHLQRLFYSIVDDAADAVESTDPQAAGARYARLKRVLRRLPTRTDYPAQVNRLIAIMPEYVDASFGMTGSGRKTVLAHLTSTESVLNVLKLGTHKPSRKLGMTGKLRSRRGAKKQS